MVELGAGGSSAFEPVITIDVDWAADFLIDALAESLTSRRVKATWFITHISPAIERLKTRPDLFELGIHPNFQKNSSHGSTVETVLRHVLDLVPSAKSMRTHGLLLSSQLLIDAARQGVEIDCTTFLPEAAGVEPFRQWVDDDCSIIRVPFNWEDDAEMVRPDPRWSLQELAVERRGLQIFNFHPVHAYLNQPRPDAYRALKGFNGGLKAMTPKRADALRRTGEGPGAMLEAIVSLLAVSGGGRTIAEIGKV